MTWVDTGDTACVRDTYQQEGQLSDATVAKSDKHFWRDLLSKHKINLEACWNIMCA